MKTKDVRMRRKVERLPHPNLPDSENTLETSGFRSSHYRVHKKRICFLCHYCGHTPRTKNIPLQNALCPKCGKSTWERDEILERLFPEPIDTVVD